MMFTFINIKKSYKFLNKSKYKVESNKNNLKVKPCRNVCLIASNALYF